VPARKRRAGYVFQDARLFPHLTVARNLDFGMKRSSDAPSPGEQSRIIEMLGIGHLLDRRPHALSGGERQRLGLEPGQQVQAIVKSVSVESASKRRPASPPHQIIS
jgi:ABC-type molybdate transport system ATPase subunit